MIRAKLGPARCRAGEGTFIGLVLRRQASLSTVLRDDVSCTATPCVKEKRMRRIDIDLPPIADPHPISGPRLPPIEVETSPSSATIQRKFEPAGWPGAYSFSLSWSQYLVPARSALSISPFSVGW